MKSGLIVLLEDNRLKKESTRFREYLWILILPGKKMECHKIYDLHLWTEES
ncbi:hypothetical protein [Filifactor alocis]|uniref:hypothetical protein n=1 Tax=Filifactor alocis TaxID=143361 RepID=UPI00031D4841|nr:hypothetical protein [Filifactor alocis]